MFVAYVLLALCVLSVVGCIYTERNNYSCSFAICLVLSMMFGLIGTLSLK